MPTALSVTAPLLLALVLVVSAVGKLRAPERSRAAFSALGVPGWLDRQAVSAAHPWGEIALALLLLLLPGPFGVAVAAVALALMLVYLALVARALRSPVEVDCACFGSLGQERITTGTVWRNGWLVLLAAVSVWSATDGSSMIGRLAALSGAERWWLVAAAAAAVTVGLVLGRGSGAELASTPSPAGEDLADYVRTPIPAVTVELGDGSTTHLRKLSEQRAQLLLFVSESCGSCSEVIASAEQWRQELPLLQVRLVSPTSPADSGLTQTTEPRSLHDRDGLARASLGIAAYPSAILLGIDGLLAGGPVVGAGAIRDFIEEARAQLPLAEDTDV